MHDLRVIIVLTSLRRCDNVDSDICYYTRCICGATLLLCACANYIEIPPIIFYAIVIIADILCRFIKKPAISAGGSICICPYSAIGLINHLTYNKLAVWRYRHCVCGLSTYNRLGRVPALPGCRRILFPATLCTMLIHSAIMILFVILFVGIKVGSFRLRP